ncbi:protein kinase [Nannocystis sp.]|uniref:serine/threonine protein kinase n=1 Tax=Nannocystis sp. TaxID=1962667 RepID=UPI0025EE25D0|nr:protein kinase [Nannocystis sp.]MBK7825026.1 protein kinase [Nannocystis sp.]
MHRDIKTGNILITRKSGQPPTAVVIDMGLVKPDRALRNAASPPTTEVGRLLCTPGYTSPEQAAGNPVDRRSDVYSMGVTLYRVLAGRLPFHEARGQPMLFVLTKHLYSEPTLLAEAGAGAGIPPVVAEVIESALRKNPNDRPQSMLGFAESLRAAAASVGAARSTTDRPVRARGRRSQPLRLRQLYGLLLAFGLGAALTSVATPRAACPGAPAAVPHPVAVSSSADDTSDAPDPSGGMAPTALWSVPLALDVEPLADHSDASVWVSAADLQSGDLQADTDQQVARPRPASASRRPAREVAGPRAIARRQADVQRCADVDTGGSDRLAIAVNIDTTGRVSAHVVGAPDSTLSRCLDKALKHTPLVPPSEPMSFVHVFKLRSTPSRP